MLSLVDVGIDHPRGGSPLLAGANLTVAGGEVVVIVGAAGVGTSRLVAAMLGEAPVSAGRIEVLGRDVGKLRRSSLRLLRRRIGIVPQELSLLDDRSAQVNVALPLEIDGVPRAASLERAHELFAILDIESEASLPVECLSQSVRQRVAVARALVRKPALIIADQPTSAQDALGTDIICTALANAAHDGATCVILGHDPALRNLAELYAWRQVVIVHGKLVPLDEVHDTGMPIEDQVDDPVATPDNVVPFPLAGAR
ncbi:MAG TPA: ATP-binding cassette domain-containing protein [Kofleriaceae bacterium]|nr:ATP-binding cassette domain-containing protein [Kofleriaceae bacterium]